MLISRSVAVKRGDGKIEAGTWVLAVLWGALLVAAPFYMALVRSEVEDAGCFAVGRDAAVPFSLTRRLGDREMALPWPTAVALAVPLAVWLLLAAAIPAMLLWKARRLARRAATIVDVLATVGLAAALGLLLAARGIPLMVMIT
jgi:hypothetical protein